VNAIQNSNVNLSPNSAIDNSINLIEKS